MKQISSQELKEWMACDKQFVLVDIREAWERELFNIGGEHIPMGELAGRANELPTEGDVVLYCAKGVRSVIAIQRLEQAGFHNLINLSGGMKAWQDENTKV
jgi:adenylyltransferase/sulfurtransferase